MSSKKNYLYVVMYNILSVVIPLLTAPYLSRILGVEGIGTFSYYYSIAYYFTLIAKMGLTNYGTRKIAEVKNDKDRLSQEFSAIFIMQMLVGFIISTIYFLIVMICYDEYKVIGVIFSIWVLGNTVNLDWFLFGVEKFRQTSTVNSIIKVIELISIFIFIREKNDVWKYCLICVVGYVVIYMFFIRETLKTTKLRRVKFEKIICHFKPCIILMIPVISLSIYRFMDKVMLGYMSNFSETGYYENAEKIIYSLTMFISSLGTVMMPKMSSLVAEGKKEDIIKGIDKSLVFISFITSAMCFGILSISGSLIPWFFGVEFEKSKMLINLLAITIIFIGWGNVIRTQYIIPLKKDNIYIKSILGGAILNVLVNLILIPKYHAIGACIGTIVAELFVPIYQAISIRSELMLGKNLILNSRFFIYGIIMLIVLKLLENRLDTSFITMIIQIIIGAIIYILLSFNFLRKNGYIEFINKKRMEN